MLGDIYAVYIWGLLVMYVVYFKEEPLFFEEITKCGWYRHLSKS